jgi:hypothetical protein
VRDQGIHDGTMQAENITIAPTIDVSTSRDDKPYDIAFEGKSDPRKIEASTIHAIRIIQR